MGIWNRAGGETGVRQVFIPLLPLDREEGFIAAIVNVRNVHRAVDLKPKLVPLMLRLNDRVARVESVGVVVSKTIGIEPGTTPIVIDVPMDFVGAGLQCNLDRAATCAPIRRVVGVQNDLELGNGIERRHETYCKTAGVIVGGTVEVLLYGLAGQTVRMKVISDVILAAGKLRVVEVCSAGAQCKQFENVAAVGRQLLDLLGIDDQAAVGLRELDLRSGAVDRYCFRHVSNWKNEVDLRVLVSIKSDVSLTDFLETLHRAAIV